MTTVTKNKINALFCAISDSNRIGIVTHTRPDGDAIGSTEALKAYIEQAFGKEVRVIVPNGIPRNLEFLLEGKDIQELIDYSLDSSKALDWINSCDLIFCLDCNGFERVEGLSDTLKSSRATKILIDHHLLPQEQQFQFCFSQTEISSASELLFWILDEMPGIDRESSNLPEKSKYALMTGMTTDTNNFANSVFPSTLQMASKLLDAGVDRDMIIDRLFNSNRENRLRAIGHLISDRLVILPYGLAYTVLRKEEYDSFDLKEGELDGYVNMPLGIGKVKLSIFLKEDNGYFRVSLRSKKGTSANVMATRYFNGGGHEQASGGRLYFPGDISTPDEVDSYVEKVGKMFFNA